MKQVEPKVFLVGEPRIVEEGLRAYLAEIGAPDWTSDAPSDLERIIETMGRVCYRSFKPGLNPNVTRIRTENANYLENILSVKHGSVIEHGMLNFIFHNVSRVFTHELVRHRVGISISDPEAMGLVEVITTYDAVSQESLRFVRLMDLPYWIPGALVEHPEALRIFREVMERAEDAQKRLSEIFSLDTDKVPFHVKKIITSAMRRIVPQGVATSIGWSANPRTIRWLLEARTDPGAEEEIRIVFGQVGDIVTKRYPNLFGDFEAKVVEGHPHYKPKYSKV